MKRKEFLNRACTVSLCGCIGMSLFNGNDLLANSVSPNGGDEPDWRIDFMQSRYKYMIDILNSTLDKDTFIPILKQLGEKCGDNLANHFKDKPDDFFNFVKSNWAESVEYDKEKGIIRENGKAEKKCGCPFVKESEAPEILCNCALGNKKRIYESLFDRQVNVSLEKSVLRGDDRCTVL